jgi:hypothetical protein
MSPSLRRKGSQQGSFTLSYPLSRRRVDGIVRAEENCYSSGAAARTFCLVHLMGSRNNSCQKAWSIRPARCWTESRCHRGLSTSTSAPVMTLGSAVGPRKGLVDAATSGGPPVTCDSFVDAYLSETHRNHPGTGCTVGGFGRRCSTQRQTNSGCRHQAGVRVH